MSGRGRGRGVRVAKPAICQMLAPGAGRENGGAPIKEEEKNAPGRSPERNGFADIENNDPHNHLPSRVKDENDRKVNRTALHEQFQTNLPPIPPCHQNGAVSNSDFDKQNGCSKGISPPVSRMPVAMGRRPTPSMTNSVQMQPHDTTSSMYTDCKAASATAAPAMAAAAMAAPAMGAPAMATPAMAAAATAVSTLASVVTPHTLPVSRPSSYNVPPQPSASQPSPIEQHTHVKMKTTTMSSQDNSSPRQKPTSCKLPQVDFRKVLEVGGETIDIKCSTAKLMREAFMVLEAYFKKKDTLAPQTRAPPGFPALPTSSSKRPTTNGLNSSPVPKTNTSISNGKAETTVPRPRRVSRVIRQPLGPHYTAEELTRAEAGQRRDELSAVKRRGCFRYVAQEKQSKSMALR